jgi:hypothetical protein
MGSSNAKVAPDTKSDMDVMFGELIQGGLRKSYSTADADVTSAFAKHLSNVVTTFQSSFEKSKEIEFEPRLEAAFRSAFPEKMLKYWIHYYCVKYSQDRTKVKKTRHVRTSYSDIFAPLFKAASFTDNEINDASCVIVFAIEDYISHVITQIAGGFTSVAITLHMLNGVLKPL